MRNYEKRMERYISKIGTMDAMRAYCDEHNVRSLAEFIEYCSHNNEEWFKTLCNERGGGLRAMKRYFKNK